MYVLSAMYERVLADVCFLYGGTQCCDCEGHYSVDVAATYVAERLGVPCLWWC